MKKSLLLFSTANCLCIAGMACPLCNKAIANGIYNSRFYPNLLTMLSAFIALALIVAVLAMLSAKAHKKRLTTHPQTLSPVPLTTVSAILGIGLGGFIDGILFHQVLQVHEMLSNKIPPTDYVGKSINMFWDGVFHAFCLLVTIIGIILMWRLLFRNDIDRSGRLLAGGLLTGWGLFNIVEGIIDHHLLRLHNVVELSYRHDTANYIFLGASVVMTIAGLALARRNKHSLQL